MGMGEDIELKFKHFLETISALGPSSDFLVNMFFLIPRKATDIIILYPDIMKKDDELIEFFGLRYSANGFLDVSEGLGYHVKQAIRSLFEILADSTKRERLLRVTGFNEENFKEKDPLRRWYVFLIENHKNLGITDALKLLNEIQKRFIMKGERDSVDESELKEALDVDIKKAHELLHRLFLLSQKYSSDYVYKHQCPILLPQYSDLREKLEKTVS